MNSHFNNTVIPLNVGQTWVGGNEITQPYPLICVSINSSSYCLLTIKQTNDLTNYDQVDSYNVSPDGRYIQEFCKCQYAHVEVQNVDISNQTYLSVLTTFTNQNQLQSSIIVSNTSESPLNVTGNVGIDANNNSVVVSNLPIVNSGHDCVAVSVDAWNVGSTIQVGIDTDYNTVQLASTSSLPAGTNVLGLVGIDTTAGANTIAISQSGTQNNVAITGTVEILKIDDPLPSGSNTIGVVGIDTALNTIKIDPANNQVSLASASLSPVFHYNQSSITPATTYDIGVCDISKYSLYDIFIQATGANGTSTDTWQVFLFPTADGTAFPFLTPTTMTSSTAMFSKVTSAGGVAIEYITGVATTTTSLDVWITAKTS